MTMPTALRAMVIAVVLTGCAAEESGSVEGAVPTPSTPAPSPSPVAEERALEVYRGMWGVVVEGSHEGAVGHPNLAEYASGQALEFTTAMLRGVEATGEPELSPEVVGTNLDGSRSTVSVEDCVDDSGWHIVGTPTDGPSGSRLVTATVVSTDGRWLVDDLWMEDYGSC
ncbi:hypothetical protein KIK06_24830 [Nocardiopsis sp. EMB25]|uniref:hypothetical protein n=1 Tax=Nocardiopsis sp. EMB25 TaxID=2835867 RepID=UPI00228412BA|nr:hypothetical protein [Nocardiopsis sp. EMB25]MCY9787114.1 hypothetical protein [Nocardiopsis sp. EMB25]